MNLIALFISLLLFSLQSSAIEFHFPVDCHLGNNCWISNLPRHFSAGKQVDFLCGENTYDGHKGTDFALRDHKQMHDGVNVLAPLNGKIKSVRDGMSDISVRVAGKNSVKNLECGNGVVIVDENGYEAQLCHLKKKFTSCKKRR